MEVKWLFWDMEYIAIVLKGATATHKPLYRAQYPRPICPGPNLPWTCGKRMGFGQIGPRELTVRRKKWNLLQGFPSQFILRMQEFFVHSL